MTYEELLQAVDRGSVAAAFQLAEQAQAREDWRALHRASALLSGEYTMLVEVPKPLTKHGLQALNEYLDAWLEDPRMLVYPADITIRFVPRPKHADVQEAG